MNWKFSRREHTVLDERKEYKHRDNNKFKEIHKNITKLIKKAKKG